MDVAFEGYLRLLALVYVLGAYLHARRVFLVGDGYGAAATAELPASWRAADLAYLSLALVAAAGLFIGASWGVAAFVLAAGSQTVVFVAYPDLLASGEDGRQLNRQVAWFHVATLLVLLVLLAAR